MRVFLVEYRFSLLHVLRCSCNRGRLGLALISLFRLAIAILRRRETRTPSPITMAAPRMGNRNAPAPLALLSSMNVELVELVWFGKTPQRASSLIVEVLQLLLPGVYGREG